MLTGNTNNFGSYSNEIDSKVFQMVFKELLENYTNYNLDHVLSLYFIAFCAEPITKPGAFGACIEALCNQIREHLEIETTVIEKSEMNSMKTEFKKRISSKDFTVDEKRQLIENFSHINRKPFKQQLGLICDALSINSTQKEQKAWNSRNDTAHGNVIPDGKNIELIRNGSTLMTLANKLLLASLSSAKQFHDYGEIGFPISPLRKN